MSERLHARLYERSYILKEKQMTNIGLSIEQVTEATGLGRTKIYALLKDGVLPAKKIGKRTLVLKSDLEAFLAGLTSYPIRNTEGK